MARIFENKEKRANTAVLEGCNYDAIKHLTKRGIFGTEAKVHEYEIDGVKVIDINADLTEAMSFSCLDMKGRYTGTVVCDERDEYESAIGESLAVKKAMDNHHAAFIRAIKRWQVAMLKKIYDANPDTFEEALTKFKKAEVK